MKRRVGIALIVGLPLLPLWAALRGPVAEWLEHRASWIGPDATVDAVYIMAGMHERDRIRGVVHWLEQGGAAGCILLPRNSRQGRWSTRDQRNLTMGEWLLRFMQEGLAEAGLDTPVEMVDTAMDGTDAEVESVAHLVSSRPDIERIALATSRFHIRRTWQRATVYFSEVPPMIPGAQTRYDRSLRVVTMELIKMLRDQIGLTRVLRRRGAEPVGRTVPGPPQSPR